MRPDRPSLTATLVAGVRALYASFPEDLRVAPDPHAEALVPAPLRIAVRVLAAVPLAAPAVDHALAAATLGMSWHVVLRTLAIDDAVRDASRAGVRQIVLLGAGLDNRAGRLGDVAARFFEVDHPAMQRTKRARLAGAGGAGDRALVPVNFETDDLGVELDRAGLSRGEPTLWIWESVTPYLTRAAVLSTLRAIAGRSAPGSRLAITYMQPPSHIGRGVARLAALLGGIVGESVHAQLERSEMEALLAGLDFKVLSDESDADLAGRYWGGARPSLGARTIHLFPEWERLAVAARPAAAG